MKKISIVLSVFSLLVLLFDACKKKETLTTGQDYQGGYIAYLDADGEHGLIAAKVDLAQTYEWGCRGKRLGTSLVYKQGAINTQLILNNMTSTNIAAYACDTFNAEGYNDWFLPSLDELKYVYNNLWKIGKGGFVNAAYTSSSEGSDSTTLFGCSKAIIHFTNGNKYEADKTYKCQVRPCRYF